MCPLRPAQVTPVTVGLDDRHPYVRRTAVMGVLKIWHMNPDIVESQGMLQHVQALLGQDSDPQVMANGLTLLMQVRNEFSSRLHAQLLMIHSSSVGRGVWA
eukprot:GHUV01023176.1.p1 GENE.GHUV01023176.1~~GHUV01023176.1.p1  ORF type:complete len:101 (+),score=13.04 GHUV01023176.1:53-355(+)